jgi:catechol 2,3-dioxygenase-like lactoylglutathione lyase family enzyme
MNATLTSVTPLIPTGGIELNEALHFYIEHLGFAVTWQSENMAGILRDGVAFNLVHNTNQAWVENASFSIGVSQLDRLYAEYRQVPARVGPLEVKPWGRREFHLIVPAGPCLQFYEQPLE